MKKLSALDQLLLIFLAAASAMTGFAAIGWFANQPFKTNSAIAALAVVVGAGLLIAASRLGYTVLIWVVDWIGVVAYVALFTSGLNILVSLIWKILPQYPHRSA